MSEVIRVLLDNPAEQKSADVNLRPKDAATLIIIDRNGPAARVLMGRRKASLRFMPGLYVFPGGRVDQTDGRMSHTGQFSPETLAKMSTRSVRFTESRARALALCAIRETYEEAGLLLGRKLAPPRVPNEDWVSFATHQVTPDLSALLYVCRAITPPRRSRRFDTRFFLAEQTAIAITLPVDQRPDTDLEALEWLTIAEARQKPIAFITGTVLGDIEQRLSRTDWADPSLPLPFYFSRGDKHLRDMI